MFKVTSRLLAALFVLVSLVALGRGRADAVGVYEPVISLPGCVSSPPPPAETVSIACSPPTGDLFPAPGTTTGAGTDLLSVPVTLTTGQIAWQLASITTSAFGGYAVSFYTDAGNGAVCQYAITLIDIDNNGTGDVPYQAAALSIITGGVETARTLTTPVPGVFGTYGLNISMRYLGGGMYDIGCTVSGGTVLGMTTTAALGSPNLSTGGVFMRNIQVFNIAGQPIPVSAGQASGTFTDLYQYISPPPPPFLIDPSGYVYESPNTAIRIPGAVVRLERFNGSSWVAMNPITDAASMDPDINPEFTDDEGRYKWDVAAGTYRVVVSKSGCTTATSSPVTIPPPVLNLNIGLTCGDADADGLKDWRETNSGVYLGALNPGTNPADADTDNDLALDGPDNCPLLSNPGQENTDGNLIDMTPPFALDDKTAPNSDALGDVCEDDDDNDGIDDASEGTGMVCLGKVSDSIKADTDGDRYLDGAECALGFDPGSAASKPALSACGPAGDADGDRIGDRIEKCFYNTDPANVDSDGDRTTTGAADGCEVGSFNTDRTVNVADSAMLAGRIALGAPGYLLNMDLNKDGALNISDSGVLGSLRSPPGQCP